MSCALPTCIHSSQPVVLFPAHTAPHSELITSTFVLLPNARLYKCQSLLRFHILLTCFLYTRLYAQLKTIKPFCDKAEKLALTSSTAQPQAAAAAAAASAVESTHTAPAMIEDAACVPQPAKAAEPARASAATTGVLKRGSAARASEAVAKEAQQAPAPEPQAALEEAVLKISNPKEKEAREKKYGKVKWVLDDPKEAEAHLQTVCEQMESIMSPGLHAGLYAKDFKKQVNVDNEKRYHNKSVMFML
jgi:hypothetical protein